QSHSVQLRCMSRAVAGVIVIPQDNQCVGLRGGIVHQPELPRQTHQRAPHDIDKSQKCQENEQKQETEENAAVFFSPHEFASILRSLSAASSGMMALKYTSLML